jgi:predicted Rdx family selenoprotein
LLKRLKDDKNGAPNVDDCDVPDHLKSTAAPHVANKYDTDDNWMLRWEWVLDEMIWAFEQQALGDDHRQFFDHSAVDETASLNEQLKQIVYDKQAHQAWESRKQRAFEMFGKYYQTLWS